MSTLRRQESTERFLQTLPAEFQEDKFWSKSLVHRPSTFGASQKTSAQRGRVDDPYRVLDDSLNWEIQDGYGNNHGRVQVRERWGKFNDVPPPALYNPDHEKKSRREMGPKHSFPTKPKDPYFEEVKYARSHPLKHYPDPFPDVFAAKKPPGVRKTFSTKKSEFGNVNIDDMRKALLPGPGSYQTPKEDLVVKFCKAPAFPLNRRVPSTKPRSIVDLDNAVIVKNRLEKNDKMYDADVSPTLRKYPSYTLGASRPLLYQREYAPTGPGDYSDNVYTIGRPLAVTIGTAKRKTASP